MPMPKIFLCSLTQQQNFIYKVLSRSDFPDPLTHQLSAFLSDGRFITAGILSGNEVIFVSAFNKSAWLTLRQQSC